MEPHAEPGTRLERDSMGEVAVPAAHLWGAQTQRALQHFAISSERMPAELLSALAQVKRAAAVVNLALGLLPGDKAQAIVAACDELLAGQHAQYTENQLRQFGKRERTNDNAVMHGIAAKLTELETKAVAAYLAGLR